jgi:predicted glutamine amidotransferase
MCRWLAYSGNPIHPSEFVLHPKHSLVAQSLDSTMGATTVNGDGFGVGWYPSAFPGEEPPPPAVYRSTEPAWNDENLREISSSVHSHLFFAHVRAATAPPVQRTNCHPFRHGTWLFMHNGSLAGFGQVRRDLTMAVDPSLYPSILGTTDSEVLFHLALTHGLLDDPVRGLEHAVGLVESVGRQHGVRFPVQMSVAVTDGSTVWAVRYSSEGRSRSLFHSVDVTTLQEMYPEKTDLEKVGPHARIIVSEPLSDLQGAFHEVPEGSVAVLTQDSYEHRPFEPAAP